MTDDEALRQAIERAVDTPWLRDDPRDARTQLVDALIAAIRAEAGTLDVERLRKAIFNVQPAINPAWADTVAAEYARLAGTGR